MNDPGGDVVHAILAASPDCIEVLAADGTILFLNDSGRGAAGLAAGDLVRGRDFADMFGTDDQKPGLRAAIQAAASGASSVVRSSCATTLGSVRVWETRFAPLPNAFGERCTVVGISRDVTALERSSGAEMVWTALATGEVDGVNERIATYTGLCPEHLLGRGWLEAVHPEDRIATDRSWSRAVVQGKPFECLARLRAGDGDHRWHLLRATPLQTASGATAGWTGAMTDVETLKTTADGLAADNLQLEQDIFTQLHEVNSSRSRLQAYFDACPDYISLVRLSHETGLVYEDINPAAETLYGLDRAAVVGRAPAEVDDAGTAADIAAYVRKCLATGRSVTFQGERTFGRKASAFVQVVGAPLGYFNEEEGLVLFCGRDVTEQRGVEEALRQSQKMEAVGQLTGGLAHDFNNLLTGITGSLDLLHMRIGQGRLDKVERYVTAAQSAASRAAALTHRLLAFSRRQTLDPKPTDVNRLVAGMSDLLVRTVGPEIAVTMAAADGLWNVLVDPSQLENALLNLCINARDALTDGGRITIETANMRLDGRRADERALPAGDYVSLSVTDDGTGMAPDVVERIFDPFFTTKPIGSGTGLGLSMIHGFAHQSGGQVRVHSALGLGTTMRILLPRHVGEAETQPIRADLSAAPRAGAGETVLVVDDEPTVRMLVAEVLGDLGYAVIEATDGNAGIAVLRSAARIDLLVTDVGLPGGVNGRQVAELGRLHRPALKVLFVTGYAENAVLNHGHLEAGMQVLTKPFAMETLASRIKHLIGSV